MGFNATFKQYFSYIVAVSLMVEETGGPGENRRPVTVKLYLIMLYFSPWSRFKLTTSVVMGTDSIGSSKSNYHMITATN